MEDEGIEPVGSAWAKGAYRPPAALTTASQAVAASAMASVVRHVQSLARPVHLEAYTVDLAKAVNASLVTSRVFESLTAQAFESLTSQVVQAGLNLKPTLPTLIALAEHQQMAHQRLSETISSAILRGEALSSQPYVDVGIDIPESVAVDPSSWRGEIPARVGLYLVVSLVFLWVGAAAITAAKDDALPPELQESLKDTAIAAIAVYNALRWAAELRQGRS